MIEYYYIIYHMIDMKPGSKDRKDFEKQVATLIGHNEGVNRFTQSYVENVLREKVKSFPAHYNEEIKEEKNLGEYASPFDIRVQNALAHRLSASAISILDYAVYARYMKGNVQDLLNGLHTYGRLNYLSNLLESFEHNGFYQENTYDLVNSVAGNDIALFQAYISNIAPNDGAIVNGIYVLLGEDSKHRIEVGKRLGEIAKNPQLGKYEKAILTCLSTIIFHNSTDFSDSLQAVLSLHNRSYETWYNANLLRYISLPAHALYNLAYHDFAKAGLEAPEEPNHRLWDSDFWQLVKDSGQKRTYTLDIKKEAPMLARWMDTLPATLDVDAFAKSLE
jgi:hypothetical protein